MDVYSLVSFSSFYLLQCSNFKQDQKFNNIRMLLKNNKKYVMSRYLDPDNPSSSKKDFYSHSKNPAELDSCRVLRYFLLVGATGFEPATS